MTGATLDGVDEPTLKELGHKLFGFGVRLLAQLAVDQRYEELRESEIRQRE